MDDLKERYRAFVRTRSWERFHNPKNLAAALSVEASELLEVFMWLTDAQSSQLNPERLQMVKDEMGDVFLYLLRLADVLNLDLVELAKAKFDKVEEKYPVEKAIELAEAMQQP